MPNTEPLRRVACSRETNMADQSTPEPASDSTATPVPNVQTPPTDWLTTGSVGRVVFWLALPVLAEQLLNTCVGLFDTFLAGRISKEATSAIGLASYVSWLAIMLFGLVAVGATALVARAVGAKDRHQANLITNQSVVMSVIMGILGTIVLFALAPTFASLQRMTGDAYDITVQYLRIDSLGYMFTSVVLVGCACLRGVGDMRTPMRVWVIINIANIIVSAVLVFGLGPIPPQGIIGIVMGTITARVIGGVLILVILARGRAGLRLQPSLLRVHRESIRRLLRIGIPAAGDGAVLWIGQFVFLIIIASLAIGELGRAYYAAHIIYARVAALSYLPAAAWGAAAATMVGQALGAGNANRAAQSGHVAVFQCASLTLLIGAFMFFAPEFIYAVMSTDELVRHVGVRAMPVVAWFQPTLAVAIIYVHALRGAGDSRYPLIFTVVSMLTLRLPMAYLFGVVMQGGLIGAWVGMCGDMLLRAILPAIRFARRRWATLKV